MAAAAGSMIAAFAATACLLGHGAFAAPSPVCTPGAYAHITTAQACTPKTRPTLPAAERRRILHRYGLTSWTGAQGEMDHRQPFALGGVTDARNVWPQAGPIPNPKDRLEQYIYRRVCDSRPQPMSLRTAHRIFATSWVVWYLHYNLDAS